MNNKLPPKGSNRYRVLEVLHTHGSMPLLDVVRKLSSLGYEAVRAAMHGEKDMGLAEFKDGVWRLTADAKSLMGAAIQPPKEVYIPQIVPPREVPEFRPIQAKNIPSCQPRRNDAGPAREPHFFTSGTAPETLIAGMA